MRFIGNKTNLLSDISKVIKDNSIDNMLIKSPCGSGKKYKNCCGKQ